jgi:hypothetical protein
LQLSSSGTTVLNGDPLYLGRAGTARTGNVTFGAAVIRETERKWLQCGRTYSAAVEPADRRNERSGLRLGFKTSGAEASAQAGAWPYVCRTDSPCRHSVQTTKTLWMARWKVSGFWSVVGESSLNSNVQVTPVDSHSGRPISLLIAMLIFAGIQISPLLAVKVLVETGDKHVVEPPLRPELLTVSLWLLLRWLLVLLSLVS